MRLVFHVPILMFPLGIQAETGNESVECEPDQKSMVIFLEALGDLDKSKRIEKLPRTEAA